MVLWLTLVVMTALAVAMILVPLVRRPPAAAARREFELEVYRAQLQELGREEERGLLGPQEAAAARLELERRMLAADADPRKSRQLRPATGFRRLAALGLLIGFPATTGVLYWQLGSPELPGQPFAQRAEDRARVAQEGAALPSVASMIDRLRERVASNPEDLEGWFRLGQAYALTEQFEAAAEAYRQAIALREDIPELHAALGETLVMAQDGIVTEPARDAFRRALQLAPSEPRARFYEGLALVQRGEREAGLDAWVSLARDAPAGAPWLADLRTRIAGLAAELGKDPAALLPDAPEGPSVAAQDDEDLRARATALAARLEAEPKDWQGWIRLARTWRALGETERARTALERGAAAQPGAPFVQAQLRTAAAELGLTLDGTAPDGAARGPGPEQMRAAQEMSPEEQAEMIRGMVEGLAARLEAQPDDVEGWRMLARSYGVLDEPQKSAEAYQQVARLLPEDVGAQLDYARALLSAAGEDRRLSAQLVAQMRRVHELDRDNPDALFHLGRAAAEDGDPAAAARYWQQLLAQLPEDSVEHAQLQRLIDQLPADQ